MMSPRSDQATGAGARKTDGVQPPASALTLTDLRRDAPDEAGYMVLDIYARKLPDYVVYRTPQRVAVQFADLPADAAKQRKMMAALNPLRGDINGLIDGWRLKKDKSGAKRRAGRYERQVADALIAALEDDVTAALLLLNKIKQEILDERTAWARFQYLLVALAVGICGAAVAFVVFHEGHFPGVSKDLYQSAGAGLLGAFFSIALGIRGRTVLPDLQWIANAMDAGLRMLVGLIGAGILVAMMDARMVNVSFSLPPAPEKNAPAAMTAAQAAKASDQDEVDQAWLKVLIFGFVAGFSERFVPDLLARASATAPAPAIPVPVVPMGQDGRAPAKKPDDADDGAKDKPTGEAVPDDEAHDDNCACETPLEAEGATKDENLPAASGGVAARDAP